jgi:hypothetical protein
MSDTIFTDRVKRALIHTGKRTDAQFKVLEEFYKRIAASYGCVLGRPFGRQQLGGNDAPLITDHRRYLYVDEGRNYRPRPFAVMVEVYGRSHDEMREAANNAGLMWIPFSFAPWDPHSELECIAGLYVARPHAALASEARPERSVGVRSDIQGDA